jgi:hypothetical protein
MVKLAYNPASGKFEEKLDIINSLAKVEAGYAGSTKILLEAEIKRFKEHKADLKRSLRLSEQSIEQRVKKLKTVEEINPKKIKKNLKEYIKTIDVFERGLIKNIQTDPNNPNILYITTGMLTFYKGTPVNGSALRKNIKLGHYIIKLDIGNSSAGIVRGIQNLDYVCNNPNPTTTPSEICLGEAYSEFQRYAERRDLLSVIDLTINYIMSIYDSSGYTRWSTIFRDRKPIKKYMGRGKPTAIFQDDTYILPIINPLRKEDYIKALKLLNIDNIRNIARGYSFSNIRNISSRYPEIWISKNAATRVINELLSLHITQTSRKIKTAFIKNYADIMMEVDGLRPPTTPTTPETDSHSVDIDGDMDDGTEAF